MALELWVGVRSCLGRHVSLLDNHLPSHRIINNVNSRREEAVDTVCFSHGGHTEQCLLQASDPSTDKSILLWRRLGKIASKIKAWGSRVIMHSDSS